MRVNEDLKVFITHFEWYKEEPGIGYVPTDKATPEAIEAMERVNKRAEKGLEL